MFLAPDRPAKTTHQRSIVCGSVPAKGIVAQVLRGALLLVALVCGSAAWADPPQDSGHINALTFGILPIGGPSESLAAWRPMLDDLSRTLHLPIHSLSVSTYEGLGQAMAEERVDFAFVSGRLALDAVVHDRMQVIAQLTRSNGSRGYYSVLLVAKDSPIRNLDDLFRRPGKLRYARGEVLSVSGYLVPETQVFANRRLARIFWS